MSAAKRKRGSARRSGPAAQQKPRSVRRKGITVQLEPGAVDKLKALARDRFEEEIGRAVIDTARAIRRRHGSVSVDFNTDVVQREDDDLGMVVTEPAGPVTVTIGPGVVSTPEFVAKPPMPAAYPKGLGEFCRMLNETPPTSAKLVDAGTLLVYCENRSRKLYFANTPHALRALRYYGVKP
jgi:hypothetical protein